MTPRRVPPRRAPPRRVPRGEAGARPWLGRGLAVAWPWLGQGLAKAWPWLGRAGRTCDVKWSRCSDGALFATVFPGRSSRSHGSHAHFLLGTMLLAIVDIPGTG